MEMCDNSSILSGNLSYTYAFSRYFNKLKKNFLHIKGLQSTTNCSSVEQFSPKIVIDFLKRLGAVEV